MTKYLSDKLKAISFISMILVVYLHAYNLTVNIGSETFLINQSYNSFIQNFIYQGVTRIAVPLFFAISGYLFFINIKKGHYSVFLSKMKTRLRTLVMPYLIWSILGLTLYFVLQSIPISTPFFTNELIREYSFSQWLQSVFINPVPYQLWFIRDLIVLISLSPLIYWLLNRVNYFFLTVLVVPWFYSFSFIAFSSEALLFFTIGAMITLNGFKFPEKKLKSNALLLVFIWILLISFKTILAHLEFEHEWLIRLLYKMGIVIGMLAVWYAYDMVLCNKKISQQWIYKSFQYTFFLYVFHEPLLTILKKALYYLLGKTEWDSFIIYLSAPTITIFIAILVGWFLKKITPRLYSLLSGGR
jgi:fucose 4-O-acetylase-like acetyltransferase